jgi:Fe-S oxidoreductase/nitrate reductase gamma subunit
MRIPTREIYWNIPGHNLLYLLFATSLIIFAYGFYRRYRLWRLGQPENRSGHFRKRLLALLKDGLGQVAVLRDTAPGLMHFFIFGGFVILTIGTILVFIQADFSVRILFGRFYLWYSLVLDLFGVLFILGIIFALVRRYILRPDRLNIVLDDTVILPLLLLIAITGFMVEGARIAITQPQWAKWSPVGNTIAGIFRGPDLAQTAMQHRVMWWFHLIISMGFIAYIPYSKLFHIIISPTNIYLKSFKSRGQLNKIDDIENRETFGVTDISEFSWKQLLDLDACTQCGRCQDECPAYKSEKPLSPKKIILDLQKYMTKRGKILLYQKKVGEEMALEPIVGEAIQEDELWACTTCMACQEHCPVEIEHVQKIIDLRRSQMMMENKFPHELNATFRGLETNANPWNLGHDVRADWAQGLNVLLMADNPQVDYLWWVGCAGSFDDRAKGVSVALARLLNMAGIKYGVLGLEEKCCGDPARRAGNEYVFQMMAEENIETLKRYSFKKILTACPHGYHILKNEYPQFGGDFEVIHHSELIRELIRNGKLKVAQSQEKVTGFHDSCYLGRYNHIYDAPRDILRSASDGNFRELPRARNKSFCCGAGGARMFMEENIGKRINHLRVEEAKEAGVELLGVSCPFCLSMLDDGIKEKGFDDSILVRDISQIILNSVEGNG